jgi:hypothetical protein
MLVQFLGVYIVCIWAMFPTFRRYTLFPSSGLTLNTESTWTPKMLAALITSTRCSHSRTESTSTHVPFGGMLDLGKSWCWVRRSYLLSVPQDKFRGSDKVRFQPFFTSHKLIEHFTLGLYRAASGSMTWNHNNKQPVSEGFILNISTLCGKGLCLSGKCSVIKNRCRYYTSRLVLTVTCSFVSTKVSNINVHARV